MNPPDKEILRKLQDIDEYKFEELVAELWEKQGWQTTVTSGSNDRGVDVIAKKDIPVNQKQAIQAKRYSSDSKVGSPDIQQYSSLKHQIDDVDTVVVVTTGSFTNQAKETAMDLDVETIDGNKLISMLNRSADDVINKYINIKEHNKYEYNNKHLYEELEKCMCLPSKDSREMRAKVIVDDFDTGYDIHPQKEDNGIEMHSFWINRDTICEYNDKQIEKIHTIAENRNFEMYYKGEDNILYGKDFNGARNVEKILDIVDSFLCNVVFTSMNGNRFNVDIELIDQDGD